MQVLEGRHGGECQEGDGQDLVGPEEDDPPRDLTESNERQIPDERAAEGPVKHIEANGVRSQKERCHPAVEQKAGLHYPADARLAAVEVPQGVQAGHVFFPQRTKEKSSSLTNWIPFDIASSPLSATMPFMEAVSMWYSA